MGKVQVLSLKWARQNQRGAKTSPAAAMPQEEVLFNVSVSLITFCKNILSLRLHRLV